MVRSYPTPSGSDRGFRVHPAEARAGLEKSGHADSTWSCVQGLQSREVSMSTSLLYHAFGIRGYEYTRTRYEGGAVIFSIRQEPETCRCSSCGSARIIHRGQVTRRFRSLPIGDRATFVDLPTPASNAWPVPPSARSRCPSPTRGGATPA